MHSISNPRVGDVYLLSAEQDGITGYNFIRLEKIDGDSVMAYGNNILYLSDVSSFSPDDYFDPEREKRLTKAALKQLFDKGTVENIYRHYDGATGFNRIR